MNIRICPYSGDYFDADDSICEYVSDDVYNNIFLKFEEEEGVDIEYFATHPNEYKRKLKKKKEDELLNILRSAGLDI
jgi:hypothetical protein